MLKKGEVVLRDDPEGITWTLKAWVTTADLTLTYETLPALRTKLKIHAEWKYRVKVLDQDLEIGAIDGKALVLQTEPGAINVEAGLQPAQPLQERQSARWLAQQRPQPIRPQQLPAPRT